MDHESNFELLTTSEVKSMTGWSLGKIRELIRAGFLPATNTSVGKRPTYHILRSDLEDLLRGKRTRTNKPKASQRRQRIDAAVPKVFG